ncbi:hypothetical protein [Nocardiopsis sp. NRRL B-16309]|uniref:hypothetical protein n=1 Tax=Nocardiopsis sp. NRRL B-16309 TaxID=1519494 RepID=UPI0006B0147B|nr:hypothetical protein [Nocardiopsis sp. NRRL B-16309]KOX10232.1 hypothetical protein ADL05_26590 [Nocardiopsis sp. NRRL B-16309]
MKSEHDKLYELRQKVRKSVREQVSGEAADKVLREAAVQEETGAIARDIQDQANQDLANEEKPEGDKE